MEIKELVMEFFAAKGKQGMFGGQGYAYEVGRAVDYSDEDIQRAIEELADEGYLEVYTGGAISHGTPYVITEKGIKKWGK